MFVEVYAVRALRSALKVVECHLAAAAMAGFQVSIAAVVPAAATVAAVQW
jgi:hypothetical protein